MVYKKVKVVDFENVEKLINDYVENDYEFVSFFYESGAYGLFDTYLLFKEKRQ